MITSDQAKAAVIVAGALAVGFVAYRIYSMGAGKVAGAAVGAVGDAAAGAVVGVGAIVGLPETDREHCARAMANGETFEASKYCPAGDFIGWLWAGKPAGYGATYADQATADLFRSQDDAF